MDNEEDNDAYFFTPVQFVICHIGILRLTHSSPLKQFNLLDFLPWWIIYVFHYRYIVAIEAASELFASAITAACINFLLFIYFIIILAGIISQTWIIALLITFIATLSLRSESFVIFFSFTFYWFFPCSFPGFFQIWLLCLLPLKFFNFGVVFLFISFFDDVVTNFILIIVREFVGRFGITSFLTNLTTFSLEWFLFIIVHNGHLLFVERISTRQYFIEHHCEGVWSDTILYSCVPFKKLKQFTQ